MQKEKIGDLLWQSKTDVEIAGNESMKQALEGFEGEISKETNKVVDDTVQQVITGFCGFTSVKPHPH